MRTLLLRFFLYRPSTRLHQTSVRLLAFSYLLTLFFFHPATAQITITNSVFPVVGDTLHYVFGNQAGAINQIFTPPGGPQAWDLSGLQPSQFWNQIMKNPATGSASASFPAASILFNPLNSTDQVYWQVTGTQVNDLGWYGLDPIGLGLTLLFLKTPSLEVSWAPINFFDIHQSSSNVLTAFDAPLAPPILLNLVPTADSFRIRITYQRLGTIDAYGTLAIPGGSFDVLRKKQTEYRSTAVDVKVAPLGWIDISTIGGQQVLPLGTDTITTFHFLNDISKEAIAICTLNTAQNTVTGVQYKMASNPAPNAGSDQTLCETTPAQLNATYMVGTPSWSVVSGPSTSSSQFSSTSDPQAIFTPGGGPGAYTLRFTVTDGMNVASDDVIITFNQAAIIDAGLDQTVCPNDTIFLHATLSGAATNMVWEKNVAFGTFVGPDTDPNAKFVLNANGQAQSFIRFGAMTNDPAGPCPSGVDTVTIFIREPIAPICPPHLMVCSDQPAFTLTGGMPAGGFYSGPGVSNNMFNPGAAGLGDHVITYSALDVNGCVGSCTFIITVDNGVPINIISNSTYCAGDPGPVIGVDPSFDGIQYQLQDAGGSNLGAPVAGTGSAIYFGAYPNGTYRVVASSAQCTGSATATTQGTPINCHIDGPNFCDCTPTGYTTVTINISAPSGMNWTVKDRIGLYEQQPPNLPMPIGTPMTYIGNNTYQLVGARTSNGYWVQMTNGFTDFDVMVGNASW